MHPRLSLGLLAVSCCALAPAMAHADVYAWVNSAGELVLTDQRPPLGARIVDVIKDNGASNTSRAAPAPRFDDQAEVRALADRVRQLEAQTAPNVAPPPQIIVQTVPAPLPASPEDKCKWADCGPWWSSGFSSGVYGAYPGAVDSYSGVYGAVIVAPRFGRHGHFRGRAGWNGRTNVHHR